MEDPRRSLPPPEETYRHRAVERDATRAIWSRRGNHLGVVRLLVFAGIVLALYAAWRAGEGWPWPVLIPLGTAFLLLIAVHERVVRRRDTTARAAQFYKQAIERMQGTARSRAAAPAVDGHPYAGDLDLFGPGSLFERIDATRTPYGVRALTGRLLSAAPDPPGAAEVRRRQEAVCELSAALDLREALAEAGHAARESDAEAAQLAGWATAEPGFAHPGAHRALAFAMPAGLLVLLGALPFGLPSWPATVWLVATLVAYGFTIGRAHAVTGRIEAPARVLANYERLAAQVEGSEPRAARLRELRAMLTSGATASVEIRRLRRIVVWTEALRNQIVAAVGIVLLWELQCALSLEAWRRRSGAALSAWLESVGEMEATASLAAYAYENPQDTFPEIADDGQRTYCAEDLGHPLLSPERCVRNSLALDAAGAVLLVSGSNMSGKSTMLRSVGANAVLAQSGTVVRASRLRMGPMAVITSMRVVDSLQQGTSHFLAELHRLKRVTDLCDAGVPLLYLLDEILHGTNSRERRIGVRDLVAHLIRGGALGMITTHDLDLADLEERHPGRVRNVHFADHLEGGALRFDYRMHSGVARTTNALRLMREVGIPLHGPEE